MTIDTLFGPEEVPEPKPRSIKLKTIKAVFETITVNETITVYLKPHTRYTSSSQMFDTFSFLRKGAQVCTLTRPKNRKSLFRWNPFCARWACIACGTRYSREGAKVGAG